MRSKILSSTSTFNGVSYNTHKTHNSKGELMKIKNFGYLQSSKGVEPDEIKTFLKAYSNRNTRVKDKQFHAMISCKGREYGKEELTNIAEDWLQKMGYGDNPYLIVFHSDTKNNHVHMVSTRIGKDGKKVKDNMEKIKAQAFINEIMKKDPKQDCRVMISNLKSFSFSTTNQAKLYFEVSGYSLKEDQVLLKLYKYGLLQGEIPLNDIENRLKLCSPDKQRLKQLQAIFNKYMKEYGSKPYPVFEPLKGNRIGKQIGYRSELSDFLKEKFGIEIIFHGKEGKDPYGYSIIDHSGKHIFKGSEVFSLKDLINGKTKSTAQKVGISRESDKEAYHKITGFKEVVFQFKFQPNKSEVRLKLLAALEEYPTVLEGLQAFNLKVLEYRNRLYLLDSQNQFFVSLESLLNTDEYNRFASLLNVPVIEKKRNQNDFQANKTLSSGHSEERDYATSQKDSSLDLLEGKLTQENAPVNVSLSISEDVDDEAINGRDRRKNRTIKRKNTR